jgi:CDGSH-type Zn-finger protein/uncharacterized Fe-S cluster protein YjdI
MSDSNSGMSDSTIQNYPGKRIVVRFDSAKCIHSRHCVLEHPSVFQANVAGPWINPDNESTEASVQAAYDCPSGAITYERLDGGTPEAPPLVNTLRIRENGPLAFRADLRIEGQPASIRATLCRCGASQNKPYCDGSHAAAGFVATGEPATQASESLATRNGPLNVSLVTNGPLKIAGNLEICTGTGRTANRTQEAWLCRCGASGNKPYCDGTHKRIGFKG